MIFAYIWFDSSVCRKLILMFLVEICEPAVTLYSVNVEYYHYKLGREQEAVHGCGGLVSRQEVIGEINGNH